MSTSTISLRLPDHLYESTIKLAESENLSVSQLITLLLAEKISLFRSDEERKIGTRRHHREEVEAAISRGISMLDNHD